MIETEPVIVVEPGVLIELEFETEPQIGKAVKILRVVDHAVFHYSSGSWNRSGDLRVVYTPLATTYSYH